MRISDWSSDVCSSDLCFRNPRTIANGPGAPDLFIVRSWKTFLTCRRYTYTPAVPLSWWMRLGKHSAKSAICRPPTPLRTPLLPAPTFPPRELRPPPQPPAPPTKETTHTNHKSTH